MSNPFEFPYTVACGEYRVIWHRFGMYGDDGNPAFAYVATIDGVAEYVLYPEREPTRTLEAVRSHTMHAVIRKQSRESWSRETLESKSVPGSPELLPVWDDFHAGTLKYEMPTSTR